MLTDISGSEIGGVTTIYFTREVDKGSHPIINAYATLIGAYFNNDAWGYHGSTHSSSSGLKKTSRRMYIQKTQYKTIQKPLITLP